VASARQALAQFAGLQIEAIPPAMLGTAEGVAIFPNMMKGGFILGVNYGRGVLMIRRPDRTWSPPVMVSMGGGSIGFQAGIQAADIVLVFATPRSLEGIMSGQKVTLGADASVALGPIGRQANAGTDARLGAEIYSYARSRGLFAGVSLGGADLSVDNNANAMLYGRFGVTPADVFEARGLAFHPEVKALIDDLNTRTPPPGARQAAAPAATTVPIQAPPQAGPAYSAPVPAAGPAAAAPPLVPVR
jgi:lipid-binding SYLF domain-containing protein